MSAVRSHSAGFPSKSEETRRWKRPPQVQVKPHEGAIAIWPSQPLPLPALTLLHEVSFQTNLVCVEVSYNIKPSNAESASMQPDKPHSSHSSHSTPPHLQM